MEIKQAILKAVNKENLSFDNSLEVMRFIMEGDATPAQVAGLIVALRMKGETSEEIAGFASAMREKASHIKTSQPYVIDTCGTGGDSKGTFNISTVAAFVIAGAGVPVAKHGNRAVSSKCGSADLLLKLGINIEAPINIVSRCLDEAGIAFLFAPLLHLAMKHAIGPRREIGIRTVFNILGPLTNPANAQGQLLGVYEPSLTETMANVLKKLGSQRAWIVHSNDGLDEISTVDTTNVSELNNGKIVNYKIYPEDFSIPRVRHEDLTGGDPDENARIALDVLNGCKGPKLDIVLLNAAAGLVVGMKAKNLQDGLELARKSIDAGDALKKLEQLREITNS